MRIKIELPQLWDFLVDPDDLGLKQNWQIKSNFSFLEGIVKMPVPACWNFSENSKLFGYTGAAWYFGEIRIPKELCQERLFIKFEGINYKATVFLEGEKKIEHEGGHIPFEIEVTDIPKEKDLFMAIMIDNRLTIEDIPSQTYWKNYGGIFEDLYIESRPYVFFDDYNFSNRLVYDNDKAKHGELEFNLYIKNLTDQDFKGKIHKKLVRDHVIIAEDLHEFDCLKQNTRLSIKKLIINNPLLWTPENPELYNIEIYLLDESGNQIDRIDTIWGFREFDIQNKGFLLNKKDIKLIGINNVSDHPEFGFSIPKNLSINDLSTIKKLGFNTVKMGPFPSDRFGLEMADRLGLLVIESLPLNIDEKLAGNKSAIQKILKKAKEYLKTMINRDKNHPSIIGWNLSFNCAIWNQDVAKLISDLTSYVRSTLKSKKMLMINYSGETSALNETPIDLIGLDLGTISNQEDLDAKLNSLSEAIEKSTKPIITSEIRISGKQVACAGESDMQSLMEQTQYLENVIETYQNKPGLPGYMLGNLYDFYNNNDIKDSEYTGILDAYRNPRPVVSIVEGKIIKK